MKLTLLQLVQDMLVAIDAENVNSVGDTPEAGMCVNLANRAFEEIATFKRWKHFKKYDRLVASTNLNELVLPTGAVAFDPTSVWYNDNPMKYLVPEDFLTFTIRRNTTEANIEEVNDIKVYNDRDPDWFTSDDDETLRFDAMPDNISGLDASLTRCLLYTLPTSRLTDDAEVFDLPTIMYPLLSMGCEIKAVGLLKGDTQEAARMQRDFKVKMGSLARNARLVDKLDDNRKWIVPRNSATRRLSPLIWTGNGFIQ